MTAHLVEDGLQLQSYLADGGQDLRLVWLPACDDGPARRRRRHPGLPQLSGELRRQRGSEGALGFCRRPVKHCPVLRDDQVEQTQVRHDAD